MVISRVLMQGRGGLGLEGLCALILLSSILGQILNLFYKEKGAGVRGLVSNDTIELIFWSDF